MILIDDADDPRLACFRRNERGLTSRGQRRNDDGDGLFMAEGDLVVERALDAGCTAVAALVDAATPPAITARIPDDVPIYAGGDCVRAIGSVYRRTDRRLDGRFETEPWQRLRPHGCQPFCPR